MVEQASHQGRRRDARIDDAVRRATLELLEKVGYNRLTIPLVAARAGASAPAVYRRFPTKVELVYNAVFSMTPELQLVLEPDLETAMSNLFRCTVALFSPRAVHSAVVGMMAELPAEPGRSTRLLADLQGRNFQHLQRFLDREIEAGRAQAGVAAAPLLDLIGGTVVMALGNERVLDEHWVQQMTHLVLGGIRR